MHDVGTHHHIGNDAAQMGRRACACRPVGHLAGIGLRFGMQFLVAPLQLYLSDEDIFYLWNSCFQISVVSGPVERFL